MEEYYSAVFLVLMLVQEHTKGFLTTLMCFATVTTNSVVTMYLQSTGISYYESYILYEAVVFLLSLSVIGIKAGAILCIVSFISCVLNIGGYFLPNTKFYLWYADHYYVVSVLLLEVLVWGCITSSKIKTVIAKLAMTKRENSNVDNN